MKKIAILPTLLTLGNGICGFVAITFASKINFDSLTASEIDFLFASAGWFIFAAMIFDMLDGYVARLAKQTTKFGGELDSLCDAVSFGIVPAFLLLKMGPGWERQWMHQLLAGIAAIYMCCALLRLARYNVADQTSDPNAGKRFRGLPTPGAAGCIATLAIVRGALPDKILQLAPHLDPEAVHAAVYRFVEIFSPLGALTVGLLMVSLVPFPHFAKQLLRGRKHVGHLVQLLLASFIILMFREVALALIFWGYALVFPIRYLLFRSVRSEPNPTPDASHGH